MDNSPILYSCILSSCWAFLITIFAIPSIIYVAHEKNLLDKPNQRTVHQSLKPRIGGLAIFAGFISALTIFGSFYDASNGIQQALAGSVIIFFIGLKDDIANVSAFKKFFVQILAAGIVIFMGDIRITGLCGFLGIDQFANIGASYALSFLVIIGITNAINLIDGLDGLAGTIITIIALSFGVLLYQMNSNFSVLSFCLAGAMIGFLRFNFYKASIFMGDTGSLVSGFLIAVVSVKFIETTMSQSQIYSPAIALAIIIIPVVDTIRVFMLRIFAGISPFTPDKNHIHHRFIDLGMSQVVAVLLLALINIIFIIGTYFLSQSFGINKLIFGLVTVSLVLCIVLEILVRKKTSV